MSEQSLAPESSAKPGRVNLHHSHPHLTFMMLVGLPFLLLFVWFWFYVFFPQDRDLTTSENRCQEQMFPDAVLFLFFI